MPGLLSDCKHLLNSSVLTIYRIFSVITLFAVLGGVISYAAGALFYALSRTWIAPVIVSSQDKDVLDLTGRILTTETTVQDLQLDIRKLEKTIGEAQIHKESLVKLRPGIDEAIDREARFNRETGSQLAQLNQQKASDNLHLQAMLDQLRVMDAVLDRELAAGLITKTDAVQAKTDIAKSNADLTDSRVATVLLRDNILDKTTDSTTHLEILNKRVELESEIATLDITIVTAKEQLAAELSQVEKLNQALATVRNTPDVEAIRAGNIYLALVPYDNQRAAVNNTRVYDCYLSFFACRQVGNLKQVFAGEQHATHPIFRTDLRGFMAQLVLTDAEAAKSNTLFLGSKPLFF